MKTVGIYIDDRALEIDHTVSAAVSHEIANIEEPDKSLTGNAKDIEVPYNACNRKIMQYSEQVLSRVQFNNAAHTARIEENGSLVMCGTAQVDKYVDRGNNSGHYALKIIGASADWARRASKRLIRETADDFHLVYRPQEVYDNSILTEPTPIKFFPVDRGTFYVQGPGGDLIDRTRIDLTDYHPFINVWMLLASILEGYTIASSIEPFLKKLYMSGFVPEQEDATGIEEDNDFKIGSSKSPDEVAAELSVRTPSFRVDLFDRWASEDGDLFVATKGIIRTVDGCAAFAPTVACTVSFRMTVSYSSTVGAGGEFVDTLRFGAGERMQELRVTPYMSSEYDSSLNGSLPREMISERPYPYEDDVFKKTRYLWFLKLKRPRDYVRIIQVERVIPNSAVIVIERIRETILTEEIKEDGQWINVHVGKKATFVRECDYYAETSTGERVQLNTGIWEESNVVEIEDGILSFNQIEFGTYSVGIGTGGTFPLQFEFGLSEKSLSNEQVGLRINGYDDTSYNCTLTPDFRNAFALGSRIDFSVVGGDKTQLQFIQALRHLFNLYFYTNPTTHEVFIEPRSSFYFPLTEDRTNAVDWTDRIDYSHEVENEQLGNNVGDSIRLAYQQGNDVIKKYNRRNKCTLGAFEAPLENKTTEGTKELVNPLFAPFVRREAAGMGWKILQQVPETEKSTVQDVEFDLTPTIGIFTGITRRTAGADKAAYPSYPVIVFQENRYNLGFEDVTYGPSVVEGLHRYYDGNILRYDRSRRITAYLRLSAIDVENIQCPGPAHADFRSVFMLRHKGEMLYLELEKIADYDPAGGEATKCSFVTKAEV